MQDILNQLGNLFLGAVPTAVLFLVLVLAYQFLVHRPLTATLKERRARTEGAVEKAHQAIADAEAKAAEYAERLRQARSETFRIREQKVKELSAERDAALDAARKAAGEKVSRARVEMDAEAEAARRSIEAVAPELALGVVRAVMPAAGGRP